MAVFKEIPKNDGSGVTGFYRLSTEENTVETIKSSQLEEMRDYNNMLNKPSINGVTLVENKTLDELGIQPAGDYLTAIPEEYITDTELESKDYATKSYVISQIDSKTHFHRVIVDGLPLVGEDDVLYLVRELNKGTNIYKEYLWVNDEWELIGSTEADLSNYYTKDEVYNKTEINDKGYLTEIPDEYVTDTELEDKGYATEEYVKNYIDSLNANSIKY